MPIIKNIGKKVRMVADRILQPGEAKDITPSQAEQLKGDADFEIQKEQQSGLREEHLAFNDEKEKSALLKVRVEVVPAASTSAGTPPLSAKAKRRGKKK